MNTNKLIILDLECTCWNDKPREYQAEHAEIIEIGITLINTKEHSIIKSESYMVKPNLLELSDFCTELTTITVDMLISQKNLKDTLDKISNEYNLKDTPWGSWGYYDLKQMSKECSVKNIKNPFCNENYINLKLLTALNNGWSRPKGIDSALKSLNLIFEGIPHRGIDDTINIARILANRV